jgi:ketopantoate reductase
MPSSMHRDVKAGGKFELASLTEFVINEGESTKYPHQMVLKNYVPFACLVKGYRYN